MTRRGAGAVIALLAAVAPGCSPATTRPPFAPLPQAAVLLFAAEPPLVAAEAEAWLTAQGVPIARAHRLDRYVETAWYLPPPDSGSAPRRREQVKTRVWADPAGPGRTRLTVETVYRVVDDPSRPPRDLERLAPAGAGAEVTERLLTALRGKFEVL